MVKIKKILILSFLIAFQLNASKQKHETLFPGLKKINDDLYVGKFTKDFYLTMERIDKNNIDMWINYAKDQQRAGNFMTLKYLPTTVGSDHFEMVLEDYKRGVISQNNELWVAYVSNIPVTEKATLNAGCEKLSSCKNPNIEMYVTVITSPDALITSHMGVSRTWEAAFDLE